MVDIETANVTPVGNWDMTGGDVKVPAPSVDTDASTKKYVDDNLAGITASSTDTLTNKTIDDFSNKVDADEIHIQVRNESGGDMTKGQLVYISGYSVGADLPLVSLADADGSGTFPVLAMINNGTISNNATGHATISGRVSGINTNAFSVGDTAYMSTTAGAFGTKPTGAGEEVQAIGIILRQHSSLGVIEVFGAGRINQSPNAGHDAFTDFVGDEHINWTASTVGTIHATNYVDNDTTDHTALSNIGTNSHAQVDTHLANTSNPHSVDAGDVSLGNVTNVATSDTAYNATSWNTNTDNATKNVIRDKVETMDTAISSNTSASHAESHNIASHSDTTATGAELDTLTGGGDTTLHDHDGISENTTHRADNTQAHSDYLLNSATDVGVGLTLTGDNNTGDTQYTAQVLHGTDASPPTASNFPRGTIYIQYTA